MRIILVQNWHILWKLSWGISVIPSQQTYKTSKVFFLLVFFYFKILYSWRSKSEWYYPNQNEVDIEESKIVSLNEDLDDVNYIDGEGSNIDLFSNMVRNRYFLRIWNSFEDEGMIRKLAT